jgi:hypothetical protein
MASRSIRVADHCVELAELGQRGVDDRGAPFRSVHGFVGRHRDASGGTDLVHDVVGDSGVGPVAGHRATEVVHHHGRTSASEVHRVQAPETTSGTRDDRCLTRELDHAVPSTSILSNRPSQQLSRTDACRRRTTGSGRAQTMTGVGT